ncbi:MAG: DNA primase [Proteobacteria bacterium]|nr:DNA primase [Pseudomonadota bacterium]
MRFSDTFLRQVRDRVSIADYAGKKLSWNARKTRAAAGDYWACCPFHQEKSASFHVLDQKGIFNCFGCGEKGDIFTLAMKLEGLNFPEAVERIAELAGMELPRDDFADRGEDARRKRLIQLAARTARLYAEALGSREGKEARDYLKSRGFDAELCTRFGIGYAPGGYTWTIDKLKADGFTLEEMVAAGIARDGEEGRRAIDAFRDRVTFEIADPSGKVIAFGARALKKDEKAKYINSPECALFSKGRTLYRLKQAREIASKAKAPGLVVAEGYLDVIAFERAGIGAVAPMGTALTDDQLQLVWRSGGEPTLCFDGDEAGKRAADRALDLALPHFGPGRTIKIAYAPNGEDPDDIFRRAGADALKALIAAASPASDALFEREKNRRPLTTPEARAAFKTALRDAANRIADADTKRLYFAELMARADAAVRSERPPYQPAQNGNFRRGANAPSPPTAELKALSAAATARPAAESFLCYAADYPNVLARFSEWIERLAIADPDLAAIRAALISLFETAEDPQTIDRNALSLHLTRSGQERAAARLLRWPKPRPLGGADADIEAEWLALATREVVLPAIREELDELRAQAGRGDDAAFARFQALSREAREIEARAREVKLTQDEAPPAAADLGAP